jgi:PadR family transcriptional regulator, regulatory protein PadR
VPRRPEATTGRWEVQVRKGVLELIILLSLRKHERYGYELITMVTGSMDFELTEGTIYPLLSRLHKDGLLTARWVEVPGGVPRKYYRLSERGRDTLAAMQTSWIRLTYAVQRLMIDLGADQHAPIVRGRAK